MFVSQNNITCYPLCFDNVKIKCDVVGVIPNCGYSVDDALCALAVSTTIHAAASYEGWVCENDIPTSDPCETKWFGIVCDNSNTIVSLNVTHAASLFGMWFSVISVMLYSYLYLGTLPVQISGLASVTSLLLGYNGFTGIYFYLRISISIISLSGAIPLSISSLKNLKVLDLSHNSFHGARIVFSSVCYYA